MRFLGQIYVNCIYTYTNVACNRYNLKLSFDARAVRRSRWVSSLRSVKYRNNIYADSTRDPAADYYERIAITVYIWRDTIFFSRRAII